MKKIIFSVIALMIIASEGFAATTKQKSPGYYDPGFNDPARPRQTALESVNKPVKPVSFVNNQPFISIEYSAPRFSNNNKPNQFKTNVFEKQMKDVENIALGLNFRVTKYFGLNANWAQTELNSGSLDNASLSQVARFNMDQYNFSGLFYLPIVENSFDIFAELGASEMFSRMNYTDSNQNFVQNKSHRAAAFYGAGFQVAPFANAKDLIRFSVQRYSGNLVTGNEYSTVRLGYLKAF